jgi:hypothetical protein
LATLLLTIHLAAVVIAPWSSPQPAPLLAEKAARMISPYLQAAYLNHGYRFFAPDPGPSHLVRYELTRADGSMERGRLPDPVQHWPRLLYHRYFMISESLFQTLSNVEELPPDVVVSADERAANARRNTHFRQLAAHVTQGLARQLLRQAGGASVKLFLVEHRIPFPQDVQQGKRLDSADLYADLADLGEFPEDDR